MTACTLMSLLAIVFAATSLLLLRKWRSAGEPASIAAAAALIPGHPGSLPQLAREVTRARRYQRPLSFVIAKVEDPHRQELGASDVTLGIRRQAELEGRLAAAVAGRIVRDALREGDLLAYDAAQNHYILALPEADKTHAVQLANRLQALVWERMRLQLRAGVTEFPADGVTIEELLTKAGVVGPQRAVATEVAAEAKSLDSRSLTTSEAA
jgi:hypothetical protein